MAKSSSELLREYAKIVSEGDLGNPHYNTAQEPEDFADDGIDLPDESMMDDEEQAPKADDEFLSNDQVPENDPVINLSRELHVDSDQINKWLKANKYELTPIDGLSNSKGNI